MSSTDTLNAQQSMQQSLAFDSASLNRLKYQAGQAATPETIRETAKQFEALFMRELMKSMRETTMKSDLLGEDPMGDMGTSMLDEQYALQMSGMRGGLSEIIAKQLMRQLKVDDKEGQAAAQDTASTVASTPATTAQALNAAASAQTTPTDTASDIPDSRIPDAARTFVQKHAGIAKQVEQTSGLPASYMLGQAGHETGWGQHEIRMADGSPSHNLFGIKAGDGWKGKTAEVTTTEYMSGTPHKVTARFRAYDSYAESYRDFARLVGNNPRYAEAREQASATAAPTNPDSVQNWAQGLQDAGYATDPDYADKLSRAINTTLLLQRRM
jgi:flagellar protein FlgJ